MKPLSSHISKRYLAVVLVCLLYPLQIAFAGNSAEEATAVPKPVIPVGQGEDCVADNDFMRRNHMDLLKHQRDETVFNGIRDKAFSLKDCISCHVVKGPDARAVSISDPKHFCRSCHDYAAVSIDCFQCHASRPETAGFPEERRFFGRRPDNPDQTGQN